MSEMSDVAAASACQDETHIINRSSGD